MKTTFLFTSIAFFLALQTIHSQSLLTIGTEWHYTYTEFDRPGFRFNQCEITGDTIINNRDCLIFTRTLLSCDGRPKVDYLNVDGDKVYFYEHELDEFKMLYDYGAQTGDTLTMNFPEGFSSFGEDVYYMRIDSTDFFDYNGVNLKRLYVSYDYMDEYEIDFESDYNMSSGILIEGLGSLTNYFHFSENGLCDASYNIALRCFNTPEFGLVQFTEEACDFIFVLSVGRISLADDLKISPNPTSSFANLSTGKNLQDPLLVLYDINGKEVLRKQIEGNDNLDLNLDLSNLNSTLHLLHIYDEGSNKLVYSEKIIKME